MLDRSIASTRSADRLPYLWLLLATALLFFSGGRWAIPLAAWLAPLFLLRFVRTHRPLPGLLLAWLARAAAAAVVARGTFLLSGAEYYAVVVLVAGLTTLPYLIDRLVTPRIGGLGATLVFPLAFVTFEYLTGFGPAGTMNSLATTQYGNLPLLQLVSVTGIWGITFLITWFAAVANWAWERQFAWPQVRGGVVLYAAILAAVLLGGGARLALFPPDASQVRVAGLSASRTAVAAFDQQLPTATLSLLLAGKATPADRAHARASFATLDGDLLRGTQQEALAGAKIVVWPEASPVGGNILQEDEPALIRQAGALARKEGIYLDMGLAVFLPSGGKGPYLRDEAVLLAPTGQVVWTYEKSHLVPFSEQGEVVPGAGKLPTVSTPYGRLANAICFDADFPGLLRQAGRDHADLLLLPADDWKAITPSHAQAATLRAIEDGFSEVRETSNGLSLAVDYQGRPLAASNYFTTDTQVMVADVPIRGAHTIYATIGDLFAWLCLGGLAVLSALAIVRGRPRRATAARPEPQPTL
jgi:apolipoprotein N-acyltransferase